MAEPQRATPTQSSFSPLQVRAAVNRFLLSRIGSVFTAGTPTLDRETHLWDVPILYAPPDFTSDEVGQVRVSAITNEIRHHTPAAEVRKRAAELHERNKNQIRTAFFRARKK